MHCNLSQMIRNAFLTFFMNVCNFVKWWRVINNLEMLPFIICMFLRDDRNDSEGQRGTRDHSNVSFLQCAALSWSGLLCSRKKIFVRLLIFRDIAWEDSQDLRETSEIYTLTALWSRLRTILHCYLLTFGKLSMLIGSEVFSIVTYLLSEN